MRFDLDFYDIGTITPSLLPVKGGAPWCHRRTGGTIAHYSVQYTRPSISSCFFFFYFSVPLKIQRLLPRILVGDKLLPGCKVRCGSSSSIPVADTMGS